MKHKTHVENRKHPRTNKCIRFKLKTEKSVVVAETINLSCIGAYCRVNEPFSFMTKLKIGFALPDSDQEKEIKQVECTGVVVRVEKVSSKARVCGAYNIAIFFNEIEESEKKKITNFIERHKGVGLFREG